MNKKQIIRELERMAKDMHADHAMYWQWERGRRNNGEVKEAAVNKGRCMEVAYNCSKIEGLIARITKEENNLEVAA